MFVVLLFCYFVVSSGVHGVLSKCDFLRVEPFSPPYYFYFHIYCFGNCIIFSALSMNAAGSVMVGKVCENKFPLWQLVTKSQKRSFECMYFVELDC